MQKALALANRLNTGFSARSGKTHKTERNYIKIIEEHILENLCPPPPPPHKTLCKGSFILTTSLTAFGKTFRRFCWVR